MTLLRMIRWPTLAKKKSSSGGTARYGLGPCGFARPSSMSCSSIPPVGDGRCRAPWSRTVVGTLPGA
eukprot:7010987-Prymnesium_polylepis.1